MERQKSDGKWYCFDAHCRKRRREAGAREAGAGMTAASEALRGVQRAQSRRSRGSETEFGNSFFVPSAFASVIYDV